MEFFNSDVEYISSLNTTTELKERLNDGIKYIFSVVTKLQKKSPDDKYEIHGKLNSDTKYKLAIRAESVVRNDPIKGQRVVKGIIYLSMYIYIIRMN